MRFPEFSGEWVKSKLGNIAEFSKGTGISKEQRSETGMPCILYGELYTRYKSEVIKNVISKTDLPDADLVKSRSNDIIIPASGETAEDIATARCVPFDNVLLGGDLNIIRLKNQDGRFFSYQLNGVRKYDIATVAQGVSVVHLHAGDLKGIMVKYPSDIVEQRKISEMISLIDDRIETQSKIIEEQEALLKSLADSSIKALCDGQ
ncbi:MAG: restriction endonuclease subunit S, partial [Bacteroidales bacterium]|nr:restriction endonuclease subunit S [Bacteroidales bacterium]